METSVFTTESAAAIAQIHLVILLLTAFSHSRRGVLAVSLMRKDNGRSVTVPADGAEYGRPGRWYDLAVHMLACGSVLLCTFVVAVGVDLEGGWATLGRLLAIFVSAGLVVYLANEIREHFTAARKAASGEANAR